MLEPENADTMTLDELVKWHTSKADEFTRRYDMARMCGKSDVAVQCVISSQRHTTEATRLVQESWQAQCVSA